MRRPFLFVLLAAVVLRVLILVTAFGALPYLPRPVLDAGFYDAWARAIRDGAPFVTGAYYHAPGYPWFLACLYRLFGADPMRVLLVQSALGVGTTLLLMLAADRLFGEREAVVAGIVFLGCGIVPFYEMKLLVESWALFLVMLAVWLALLGGEENRRSALWGVVGLLLGLAAVTRPNLLLIPLVLFGFRAVMGLRRRSPWRVPLLGAVGLLVALLPSALHNLSAGSLAPVATNGGVNFWMGNHRGARGIYEDPPGFSGVIARQEAEGDSILAADLGRRPLPDEASREWSRRALAEIAADPGRWITLLGRKAWLLVDRQEEEVNGNYAFEASRVLPLRALPVPFNALVAGGIAGLILAAGWFGARRGARGSLETPAAILIAVVMTALGWFVMSRLRLVAVPILAILSAHAFVRGWDGWKGAKRAVIAVFVAFALFIALTWNSPLGAAENREWMSRVFIEAGRGFANDGKTREAIRCAEGALSVDPKAFGARLLLGEQKVDAGDLAGATVEFEQARDSAPDNAAVRSNLGILYYQAGRSDDSKREMEAAIRLAPAIATPWYYRGLVFLAAGDTASAERDFRAALDRNPDFAGARARLAELSRAR